MGFIEDLAALTATIRQRVAVVKTEEATKMSLIVPMLQTWGYDPFNPLEVTPEYTADVGTYEEKQENKQPLEKLTDIYRHREAILAAIRRCEGDGQ